MVIRNGVRVFAGNFILVWKHLLFILFVALASIGIFMLSGVKLWEVLESSGWVAGFNDMLESVYASPSEFATNFKEVATNLFLVIRNNFASLWPNYLLSIFVCLFVPAFLYNVGEYSLGTVLYNRTKSLLNKSYFTTIVSTLGRSSLYALLKIAVSLPFLVLLLVIGYGYGILANNWLNATLLLPILIMLVIFVLAARYSFLIGFLPEACSAQGSVGSAFAVAIEDHTKGYAKKLMHYFALFIVEFGAVLFISVFSVGVGFLIALPSVCLLNLSCSLASYYAHKSENFYAGEGIIIKPITKA